LRKDDHPTILMNWLKKYFGKDSVILVGFRSQKDRDYFDKNLRPMIIKDKLVIKKLPEEAKSVAVDAFLKDNYSDMLSRFDDEELHWAINHLEKLIDGMLVVITAGPHGLSGPRDA